LFFFAAGCGGEEGAVPATTEAARWEVLATMDWELDAARESATCMRTTVERDLSITMLEAIGPRGTHHTTLATGPVTAPNGSFGCDVLEPRTVLFGSAIGQNSYSLPPGIVARVRAGEQLLFSLHLFNPTARPLRGTSGVRVLTVEPSEEQFEAEAISVWTPNFSLPPGRETVTRARCTFTHEASVFALHPHMHALGTHMKVLARAGNTTKVLHDARFDFQEQSLHQIEPVTLAAGDRLEIECTHRNTTGSVVNYGTSSKEEMCGVGVSRYPASRSGMFFCSE
jgi:hypothetical protein